VTLEIENQHRPAVLEVELGRVDQRIDFFEEPDAVAGDDRRVRTSIAV
jgi:hypothetical protein